MYTKDGSSIQKLILTQRLDYQVRETQPLRIDYKGKYRITSSSAPVSRGGPGTVEDSYLMIESLKFAYTQRTLLGDPDLVPGLEAAQDEWTKPDADSDVGDFDHNHDQTVVGFSHCGAFF
ncbi:hypothetical protein C8R42DRAFT_648033 [Lentinula raphanica]|nr:hypothetical protein C8R42DRAFT_648033 [Lentinula raphanica]KAJ3754936.1 hypothetical protein EV360DRAFT_73297 [Lentinula raphanica]